MSITAQNARASIGLRPSARAHYSTGVQFFDEGAERISTSVEIYEEAGKWYCRICRGDEKTRPMGPYSKREAERIQDIRASLLAKIGTAQLIFEEAPDKPWRRQS